MQSLSLLAQTVDDAEFDSNAPLDIAKMLHKNNDRNKDT